MDRIIAVGDDLTLPPSILVGDMNLPEWAKQAGLANKIGKGELVLNVKDFGAIGDGVANDGAFIQAAVNAAIAANRSLYWPAGTYLKTVNITNFHTVKHTGEGAVKHGADLFYVEPRGMRANKLYVATSSASDTYDGINTAFAIRTTNKAVNVLPNYGPVLQGLWTIQLAAGTYADRVVCPTGLDSVNPVTIQGPIVNHPNVPTAVFNEGYNTSAAAFKFMDVAASFTFSNIKFDGYNGTTSSAGIQITDVLNESYVVNCHFVDCYWGVTNQGSKVDWKGGITTRCGYLGDTANNVAESSRTGNGGGYRGLMQARHSIGLQSAGVLTNGPYFNDGVSGIFAQESCTGHADYCTFVGNDFGVNLNVNSRANVDGSSFKTNKIDLRGIGNSHFYVSTNVVFGTGADESDAKVSLATGSQVVDDNRIFTNIAQSYATSLKSVQTVFPNQTIQTTSLTTFYTATLAAMIWRDAVNSTNQRKRVTVKVYGELIGTAGTKNVVVRLGTQNVTATFTSAEVGVFEAEATVFFTGTATQFLALRAYRHIGTGGRIASAQGTNAMTSATALTVEASVGVATDSVRIDAVDLTWG